jgi:hypothetical protein
MRRRFLAAALAAAVLLGGCGAPDQLEDADDRRLAAARERLDDALDAEEAIRTSPQLARDLRRRVQRAAARSDARALGRAAPSLITERGIDTRSVSAFVRLAERDAPGALLIPARREVDEIVDVIDDSGADADTEVPSARGRKLDDYLAEVERDIGEVWPPLSNELEKAL